MGTDILAQLSTYKVMAEIAARPVRLGSLVRRRPVVEW